MSENKYSFTNITVAQIVNAESSIDNAKRTIRWMLLEELRIDDLPEHIESLEKEINSATLALSNVKQAFTKAVDEQDPDFNADKYYFRYSVCKDELLEIRTICSNYKYTINKLKEWGKV